MIVTLMLSRLDFGNALLVSLPAYLVRRLQLLQNAAARLPLSDHITYALVNLHWLCVSERVALKIAVLVYKVVRGQASHYLQPLHRVADLPGRRTLRSAVAPAACKCTLHLSDYPLSVAGPSRLLVCVDHL